MICRNNYRRISQNLHNEREEDCAFDPTDGQPTKKTSQFFEFIGGTFALSEQKIPCCTIQDDCRT
jgi:hypothetical protein